MNGGWAALLALYPLFLSNLAGKAYPKDRLNSKLPRPVIIYSYERKLCARRAVQVPRRIGLLLETEVSG